MEGLFKADQFWLLNYRCAHSQVKTFPEFKKFLSKDEKKDLLVHVQNEWKKGKLNSSPIPYGILYGI